MVRSFSFDSIRKGVNHSEESCAYWFVWVCFEFEQEVT